MKTIIYITNYIVRFRLFLMFFLTVTATAQENMSLDECYKLARENHPYFKDKERIENSANLKIKNTSTQWLPSVNLNGQATYQSEVMELNMLVPDFTTPQPTFTQKSISSDPDQYKLTLDINQTIYDGGSISAQKQINASTMHADLLQNESDLQKIKDQVNQVFFSIFLNKENINLFETTRKVLEERKKTIESGLKNGTLQQSDLENINIELIKNIQQINELKIAYSNNINNLSILTGKTLNDSIMLESPILTTQDTGSFQRAELKMMDAQKTSLLYTDALTQSQCKPRLYAFAQAGYGKPGLNMLSNDFNNFYIIGLTLKWNLWDWNKTSRDRQVIGIQQEMIDSRKQALEQTLQIQANSCKSRINQLESSLQSDASIVELRSSVTKRSAVKLELGIITATDYINDLNAETQAKIQLQTHTYQLQLEKANYLIIKGM